jgi:Na+-transporting methylmalonyl-CoA/oxaloacetate decarboxylase gamma subunit
MRFMDPRVGADAVAPQAGPAPPALPDEASTERAGATLAGPASTAELLRDIADEATTLVRQEVTLAKQELQEGLTQTAKAGSVLAVAGVVGLYALGFLLTTLAWILEALGLPTWAGFGIVTLLLLIVAGVAGLIGVRQLQKAKVAPDRAKAQLKTTTDTLKAEAQTTAQAVQAELRTTAQETQQEAKALPARLRERINGYTEQARQQLRRRAEASDQEQFEETRRGRGYDGG